MSEAAVPRTHPLDTMLAVSDVIATRRYVRIYARVLALDAPTVEELSDGLESSKTTVYEDVNHLVEIGILERVTDSQPYQYRARRIELSVRTGDNSYRISPALLVTLARSQSNENLRLYLDRHGTAGLATALEYARDYVRGRMNARIMAREQDLPVLEAETVLQELREILLDVEPDISEELDTDEVDAAVDERIEE